MPVHTIVYSVVLVSIAFLLAFFQYGYNTKRRSKQQLLFMGLRFITWLSVLLLLLNPEFKQQSYYVEKPNLVVAVDNSSSVPTLEDSTAVRNFVQALRDSETLKERFQLRWYAFGNRLTPSDSLSFTETRTNISQTLQSLDEVYKNTTAPTLLLTDGNQTLGTDYQYTSKDYKNPVFPVILGDTATYTDLKIQRLNANRYAYLNNKFPVEVVLAYEGQVPVRSRFTISSEGTVVHTETIRFSPEDNSKILTVELPAEKVGLKTMKAEITPTQGEKNTANNTQLFAVEVIDEKANIAIVSNIVHPDIGTLKQLITHNEQWQVTVTTPEAIDIQHTDVQLFILYQPDSGFSDLLNTLSVQNKNTLIITGTQTDWSFLNSAQSDFSKTLTNVTEEVQPEYNAGYLSFLSEDIGFSTFPPLQTLLGTVTFRTPAAVLLYQKIGSIVTEYPLLATFEEAERRGAALFGQGLWKWRAEHFRKTKSFEGFDAFFGKLIQYLIADRQKDRLNIFFESFYYGNSSIKITAEFFDKNYSFNPRASLEIKVSDKVSGTVRTAPLLLKNRSYEVDLSALPASDYTFTITETGENNSKSGTFRIIEFDVEKQFLNADAGKLKQLAATTQGAAFFMNDADRLIQQLSNDQRFIPIQKSKENIVPLIAWKYLLIIIIVSLSAEWFLRKYNGLI